MNKNKIEAMSLYLAFRYLPIEGMGYSDSLIPTYPKIKDKQLYPVKNTYDIDNFLKEYINNNFDKSTGILLSGGIDSAILASYLPEGSNAYTIYFKAEDAIDESINAKKYANAYKLNHKVVTVLWEDYIKYTPILMEHKKGPLHAIEVALYKAALEAKKDGITKLIVGNGADSNFGGMDKLLSKDWTFDEFVNRYSFILPQNILKEYIKIDYIYEPFRKGEYIDYISFLNKIHGVGIIQSFENSFSLAGINAIEPYENMYLNDKLDLEKIRNGNTKYLLRELFSKKYNNFEIPDKIPFRRPMDQWLYDYNGDNIRDEFISSNIKLLSGDQKWLVYCLELFLNINNL
ncbi:asparagine synthase-related protein [Brachyspira pulli]|uniref:asparagine synthase-related protein n=1 Tax=Brachyspira pulli TaxID=310721 RepID=UPI003007928E